VILKENLILMMRVHLPLLCISRAAVLFLFGILGLAGCGGASANLTPATGADLAPASPAFGPGQPIPRQYTCDGGAHSPPLHWAAPPTGTQSLALIVDDPDAPGGTWTHWVLYGLPASTRELPESVPPAAAGPDGSRQGQNSSGQSGYGGPCPPNGTHRYFFKLYALDTVLTLAAGATAGQLQDAMSGHVLAHSEFFGTYAR